jgi:hypothetical protein
MPADSFDLNACFQGLKSRILLIDGTWHRLCLADID